MNVPQTRKSLVKGERFIRYVWRAWGWPNIQWKVSTLFKKIKYVWIILELFFLYTKCLFGNFVTFELCNKMCYIKFIVHFLLLKKFFAETQQHPLWIKSKSETFSEETRPIEHWKYNNIVKPQVLNFTLNKDMNFISYFLKTFIQWLLMSCILYLLQYS